VGLLSEEEFTFFVILLVYRILPYFLFFDPLMAGSGMIFSDPDPIFPLVSDPYLVSDPTRILSNFPE
jgi:hypothetical protein